MRLIILTALLLAIRELGIEPGGFWFILTVGAIFCGIQDGKEAARK